jgi:hypothetical protein
MKTGRRVLKRMGYLADQQGIINRYLREQGGWDEHLYRCRNYIIESVKRRKPELITILGSGWLLDIPLEELAEGGTRINLVDINHPAQVRRKVQQFSNVELVEYDITGGLIETIWKEAGKPGFNLPGMVIPALKPDFDCGMILSVNILTQLDMLLAEYLAKYPGLKHGDIRHFRKGIQDSHLGFLQSVDSLLITDWGEEIWSDGELSSSSDLLFTGLPQGNNTEEWKWEFDTNGLYYSGKKVIFRVLATELSK